jgi:hypothetical protein
VVYLSDGIDGSSAVDRELFVASVKQIHSECFTQTVLILTNNDDDNDMGQESGEEVVIDCQVIQSMLGCMFACTSFMDEVRSGVKIGVRREGGRREEKSVLHCTVQ